MARCGRQKAIVAVGHRLLIIIDHVLRHGQTNQEPTPTELDQLRRHRARNRAIDQLRHIGYDVSVTPKPTQRDSRIFNPGWAVTGSED